MWKYCVLSKWTFLSINGISTANYLIILFRFFANWYERKFCYHGDVSSLLICYPIDIWLTSFAHILKFSFIDNIRKISLLKVLNLDFLLKILKYWMHKRRCTYTCIRCTICNTHKEKNLYHELFCLNYIANTVS